VCLITYPFSRLFDEIVWRQAAVVWATEFARRYGDKELSALR
jgi:hypothetical protein